MAAGYGGLAALRSEAAEKKGKALKSQEGNHERGQGTIWTVES